MKFATSYLSRFWRGLSLDAMKPRTWMLFGALAGMPLAAMSGEPAAAPAPVSTAAPATAARAVPARPEFDLRSARVQGAIRNAASESADPPAVQDEPEAKNSAEMELRFRAPRRFDHMDCSLSDCVAYTADGDALYSIPREQYSGVTGNDLEDRWLSCQSGNDLLTTFERYDKCRGVTIGLPVQVGNTVLNLPLANF
jgi:hypothetical protein